MSNLFAMKDDLIVSYVTTDICIILYLFDYKIETNNAIWVISEKEKMIIKTTIIYMMGQNKIHSHLIFHNIKTITTIKKDC